MVKRSAVVPEMMVHEGPARVFDCEEDAIAAIKGGKIVAGDVVVIRYEGPKGGPGMREMLNPTSAIAGMGLGLHVALDYGRTFQRRVQRSKHRSRIAGGSRGRSHRSGGRRAILLRSIFRQCTLNVEVFQRKRWRDEKRTWKPREPKVTTGYLARYAAMVTSGNRGAVLEIPKADSKNK